LGFKPASASSSAKGCGRVREGESGEGSERLRGGGELKIAVQGREDGKGKMVRGIHPKAKKSLYAGGGAILTLWKVGRESRQNRKTIR